MIEMSDARKKALEKLEKLYDERNNLLARINNIELDIDTLLALIASVDNRKIVVDEDRTTRRLTENDDGET